MAEYKAKVSLEALAEKYGLGDIPREKMDVWDFEVRLDKQGHLLRLIGNSKYGTQMIGSFPDGHLGWRWAEEGGGGPITIPYAIDDDEFLLIGLLQEYRSNLGGDQLCAIGGFKEITESHDLAQAREAKEETGLDTTKARKLPGIPFVSNRNYFIANSKEGEGIPTYTYQLDMLDLAILDNGWYKLARPNPNVKGSEFVRFMSWQTAIRKTCDGIARAGIATLLADIVEDDYLPFR